MKKNMPFEFQAGAGRTISALGKRDSDRELHRERLERRREVRSQRTAEAHWAYSQPTAPRKKRA